MSDAQWFSDAPNAARASTRGRAPFIEKLRRAIDGARLTNESTVFGLIGGWGSGKTSILSRLADDLTKADGWTVVHFNPWTYSDIGAMQLGFFSELARAFPGGPKGNVREQIAGFASAVAPLTSLGSLLGVDPSAAVSGVSRLIAGDQSASARRRQLETALERRAMPLLVVIDDLDRVPGDELLMCLKLVRMLGRLPHVHYLLSYDEATVLDVLASTSLAGDGSKARGREYLEKIVQIRFDIPALRPSDALALVNEGINTLAQDGYELTDRERDEYTYAYFDSLAPRLTTPRAIIRYFAQVRLTVADLTGEVDLADFLILSFLRSLEPGAYALIQRNRAELLGDRNNFFPTEEKQPDFAQRWAKALEAAGTRSGDVDRVAKIIGRLFPTFGIKWKHSNTQASTPQPPHVGNPDYFDRYFLLGVPPGDIKDSVVRDAIADLAASDAPSSPAVDELTSALSLDSDLVIGKVRVCLGQYAEVATGHFRWLAEAYLTSPDDDGPLSPRSQIDYVTAASLTRASDQAACVEALINVGASNLALRALSIAARGTREASFEINDESKRLVASAVTSQVDVENMDPAASTLADRHAISHWLELDRASAIKWLRDAASHWDPLDAACLLIGVNYAAGVKNPVFRLSSVDLELVSEYIDLEALESYNESDYPPGEGSESGFGGPIDSPAARRAFVLAAFRSNADIRGERR